MPDVGPLRIFVLRANYGYSIFKEQPRPPKEGLPYFSATSKCPMSVD